MTESEHAHETNESETADQAAACIAAWANERNLAGPQVRMIFEAGIAAAHRLRPDVLPGSLIGRTDG